MSIFDFFKPRWKHSSASVRREAVTTLKSEQRLLEIAKSDPDDSVRHAAAECITDANRLLELARYSEGASRRSLVSRIRDEELLTDLAIRCQEDTLYEPAIDSLHEPGLIARVARTADYLWARVRAVDRIDDQSVLLELVENKDSEVVVQRRAVQRITDQVTLDKIARSHPSHDVRRDAARTLTDPVALTSIACAKDRDDHWDVATTAVERLEDIHLLRQVAREARHEMARLNAAKKLSDSELLVHIVTEAQDGFARRKACEYLQDGELWAKLAPETLAHLEKVARGASDAEVRRAATSLLRNPAVLLELFRFGDAKQRTVAYSRLKTVAPEVVSTDEFADVRVELIKNSLTHLVFAEGYPFNAAAFGQDQELTEAIQQLVDIARSGNAKARGLLKAVHDHALGCSDGVYAMKVVSLHRGTLRIAWARRLAKELAGFA